ncbi:MAG: beta-ketoacyl-[acyl-carrier-protein] synthase family protein [Verrucomicrobiota bacterium]|nr:beta-ketoacyl-[acyl-carrier-protein] synthase family protein [Verrucomicrobiota bacterium]
MNSRRVVVTGMGVITCAGPSLDSLWEVCMIGKSPIRKVTKFDTTWLDASCAGEIDFDPDAFFSHRQKQRLDRFSQLAHIAAGQAIADTRLDFSSKEPRENSGVCLGTALGGISSAEEEHSEFQLTQQSPRSINPFLAIQIYGGSSTCNLAQEFGLQGVNNCYSQSCASGTIALGEAFRYIKRGEADMILAGGAEAPLCPMTFTAFANIKTMTRSQDYAAAYRPFDKDRDGFVMGEGAAILVLEELDHALKRGAPIVGEISGYGLTCDAYHMTSPLPNGSQAVRAIKGALKEAGMGPDEIEYINAHASGTIVNDRTETEILKQVFGNRATCPPVSGTKPFHAHPLGATGAIEAALVLKAMGEKMVPPTINLEVPGEGCDLDYIPLVPRPLNFRTALSNSFGFGGVNASLVLKEYRL